MKKSLSVLVSMIAVLSIVSTPHAVTGRIVNVAGEPISGVSVSLIKSAVSTTTKNDGTFSIQASTTNIREATSTTPSVSTQLMKNGRVHVTMSFSGNLELRAVNLHGKVIGEFKGFVEQGSHDIPILAESRRAELVILRFKIVGSRALMRMNSFKAIDTLRFSKSGYATHTTHIDSMTENMGTMVMNPAVLPATDFYRLKFLDSGNILTPHFVLGRLHVTDSKNVGVTGLEGCPAKNLCEFRVDNVPVDDVSSLSVVPYWKAYANTIHLVIDRGNVMPAATFDSLKAAVKDFVRAQREGMIFRVFTFGTVVDTLVQSSNDTTVIFTALDGLVRKGNTNNLHGALYKALTSFPPSGDAVGPVTVVAFTDGLDDEAAYSTYDVSNALKGMQIWIVAGTWTLFSPESFKGFADDRVFAAPTAADLRSAFRSIHAGQRTYESSFYNISFKSPQRNDLLHKLEMRILTNTNTGLDARDTIYFNSKNFVDGSAPTLKSIKLEAVPNRGLRVTHEYFDADGDPEGDTKRYWYKALNFGEWQQAYYTVTEPDSLPIDTTNDISYFVSVLPCQTTGTPLCGIGKSDTIHFRKPTVNRLFLKPTAFLGKTLRAQYVYSDLAGRAEGATQLQWYRDNTPISGATASTYKVVAADTGHYLSFSVTPVAQGKYKTIGVMVKSEEVLAHGTTVIDPSTGHEYPIVTIGAQTWMTQNLRTSDTTACDTNCWRNGTMMNWTTAVTYSGTAATYKENNRKGVCPTGWHIPTNNEWDALSSTVRTLASLPATPDSAGYYLKARKGWVHPGNDRFRFNAQPTGNASGFMSNAYWWSASHLVSGSNSIANYTILLNADLAFTRSTGGSTNMPVRCVKDY